MTASKKEIKSKTIFVHKFLEFCYYYHLLGSYGADWNHIRVLLWRVRLNVDDNQTLVNELSLVQMTTFNKTLGYKKLEGERAKCYNWRRFWNIYIFFLLKRNLGKVLLVPKDSI